MIGSVTREADAPIRAEILGLEGLDRHAYRLAADHRVAPRPGGGFPLLRRLEQNARVLRRVYGSLTGAVERDEGVSPAAEWLIDNYHVIDDQVREIRDGLPRTYYRQLPKLVGGEFASYPRVYAVVTAYVAHSDSRFDSETLRRFVEAYQRRTSLTMGELWAIPVTLKIVLVENARRIAETVLRGREGRAEANAVADRLIDAARPDVNEALRAHGRGSLDFDFATELVQRLRESDVVLPALLDWLEGRLDGAGISVEELVERVQREQVATHATIGNVITTMREVATFDWATFFESVSLVEAVLRGEPAGVYPRMDFATRDHYRHGVETMARHSSHDELEVTRRVVERAAGASSPMSGSEAAGGTPAAHVGHHLIGEGRRAFERDLGYRVPVSHWLRRAFLACATPGYLGTIALVSGLLLALLLAYLSVLGASTAVLIVLGLLALVPATDLAIAVVQRDLTELLQPWQCPKLDFSDGVPAEHRTLIAVPTILGYEREIREQVERLERHYLGNPADEMAFALLSDWGDAAVETGSEDDRMLAVAAEAITELNRTYGPNAAGTPRFLLLHRRRTWNEREGSWMGWERKRGKLHELNRLLRGDEDTGFIRRRDGLTDVPPDVRYVITLDADTRMTPGSALRLIGAMAHPLNHPRFDPERDRIVRGYGILQPRVTPLLPSAGEGSVYHLLFSSPTGIDPYAAAVSNVYQDLFGEGSFVGKGIYDVDAFEAALAGRIPENLVLSHDLFEGLFARAGAVTDIELFDDFPAHYVVAARRRHRWARGDWQLLPWILGSGPRRARRRTRDLPVIGRWKMIDNLRQTLSAPSTFLLLVTGWIVVPASPLLWTGFVVATIATPAAVPVVTGFLPRRRGIAKRAHARIVFEEAVAAVARVGLAVVLVADRALRMSDAVLRTLVRVFVTGRKRLEWVTAAQSVSGVPENVGDAYRQMWRPVAAAVAAALLVAIFRPDALVHAVPVISLWVASPLVALYLGRPLRRPRRAELAPEDSRALRNVARRTWRYFETVVGSEDHHLPPDNLQIEPERIVAHRTSPTNIGAYLLSVHAAHDFGWIGTLDELERLERTFESMERLDRHQGHLFNWYDTRDLRPLRPGYLSTVDSGNLAGHLLTVAQTCRERERQPLVRPDVPTGIGDTVGLAREAATRVAASLPMASLSATDLERTLERLELGVEEPVGNLDEWRDRLDFLGEAAETLIDIAAVGLEVEGGESWQEFRAWSEAIRSTVHSHRGDVDSARTATGPTPDIARRFRRLAERAETLVAEMDFGFLYDRERKLFRIGYRVDDRRFDSGTYDLLASEARLASFVAIAKGDVPVEHWFHLSRSVTPVGGGAALVSWSGSMFEYLMPALVMDPPPGTLLETTARLVVGRQIRYGRARGVPWGISESAYNARDLELTYQYSPFGVPGLGLTRGLVDDLVVAPYATALAAMIDPVAARENFEALAAAGAEGRLGFYEALDYTASRIPDEKTVSIVRAYMSHHQGMVIIALDNVLNGSVMRRRFHAVPRIGAAELLLQERVPRGVAVARPHAEEVRAVRHVREALPAVRRVYHEPGTERPHTHLLSNGRYDVMLTVAGSGFSRWETHAVTRWREDPTRDDWGSYVFLRDVASGRLWSAGVQPSRARPDRYAAVFAEDHAEFLRLDEAIETTMEVVVSPEDDGELRRVTLKNLGASIREIEVTSYAEVVLAPHSADMAHPAFSKLFVETDFVDAHGALLAHRRPREADDELLWGVHGLAVEAEAAGGLQYETDRARFLGRGRGIRTPICVVEGRPLSNTVGSVLDPIFSLRRTVRLRPGESARLVFSTLVAGSRREAVDLADKYDDPAMFERQAALAWTRAQVQLQHLHVSPEEAQLFQRLASALFYSDPRVRASSRSTSGHRSGQRALWSLGISGDLPIVLVTIDQMMERAVVAQILRAHEYWGLKGQAIDVVVLNEHAVSYGEDLQQWLERTVEAGRTRVGHETHRHHGEVFLLRSDQLSRQDRNLLRATARIVLTASRGTLAEQLEADDQGVARADVPLPVPTAVDTAPPRLDLDFFNGLGGFGDGGREYVTVLGERQWTPAPWVNVIANPEFGFIVSETGSGFTWSVNSRENRLTPWSNDPVTEPPAEVLYVQDEESGVVWTPTALPIRGTAPYVCRHGAGYSRFEHASEGVELDLLQFVPLDDPVKISRLTVRNTSRKRRKLGVTAYVEWVLGIFRETSAPHTVTEVDPATGAIFARNDWIEEFAGRVAFADLQGRQISWTCDRTEFLGRNGTYDRPAGMRPGHDLSGAVGPNLDPCAALRRPFWLEPGQSVEIVFLLGQADDAAAARALVDSYRTVDVERALERVVTWWDDVLGGVQVRLPDASMSILLNRWLLYQALACRVWARSAFYQSGGAIGFRDQLQDVMALAVAHRRVAREQILEAAAHQFPEGDVLHWWHPPSGRGVRTRITDDRLWLPYALAHYMDVTGDSAILDETVPFVEGPELEEDEHEIYIEPTVGERRVSVFEHCARVVDASLETGPHGLPLIGTGDWNDGMNRVGEEGRGESVWMGWFLHAVLERMIPLAEVRGERERAKRWLTTLGAVRAAMEESGWDGDWYRRAYFDDGTPLGSAANQECRIDSIAQSWAAISGGGRPERVEAAMKAVEQYLVRPGDGLVLLFTPPFDTGALDPGYIQGYPPGVRENGGQYTHAAIWTVIAMAILGDGDKAAELFSILNPVNHASTRAGVHRYKVEPYVAAADVYSNPIHTGRGGWTWYTGSAGWMYRAGVEWILGFRIRGKTLHVDPCIPRHWEGFEIDFRYHSARYEVRVENPNGVTRGVASVELDGTELAPFAREGRPADARIGLADDGAVHRIRVVLGGS